MVLYRGKYDLRGLAEISPEMERDLDLAYGICMSYREEFPCEMCGRCCRQPNIVVRPEEVERVSAAAGTDLYTFMTQYVRRTGDGRILFSKGPGEPCRFLGKDNRCTIWKDRPQICDDFPYLVSMFMSRVYLALTNDDADVLKLIDYMDDSWPCTAEIKRSIVRKVEEGRRKRRVRSPTVSGIVSVRIGERCRSPKGREGVSHPDLLSLSDEDVDEQRTADERAVHSYGQI